MLWKTATESNHFQLILLGVQAYRYVRHIQFIYLIQGTTQFDETSKQQFSESHIVVPHNIDMC
jgi:hypothetical protein